jgi:hypothetical protein
MPQPRYFIRHRIEFKPFPALNKSNCPYPGAVPHHHHQHTSIEDASKRAITPASARLLAGVDLSAPGPSETGMVYLVSAFFFAPQTHSCSKDQKQKYQAVRQMSNRDVSHQSFPFSPTPADVKRALDTTYPVINGLAATDAGRW